MPHHLQRRWPIDSFTPAARWHWINHHLAHAASAFLPSPFEEAAVLCIDGRGEVATTSYWYGTGTKLDRISEVVLPNSLGLLYEQATKHLGFLHSSDEYKVMALASFGKPTHAEALREAIRVCGGQYEICAIDFSQITGPRRIRGEAFQQHHYDLARSLQVVLEEVVLQLCDWLHSTTGSRHLCMAGGVALNCVMNSRIRDSGLFEDIWVQPAAGDDGTALGAALWVDATARGSIERRWRMCDTYLGPDYSDEEIRRLLDSSLIRYSRPPDLADVVAEHLLHNKVVGWFQGRMEFGPRALGSRSILASPMDPSMQDRLNQIKDREDFRPVAPVVLEDRRAEWFSPDTISPFMLFVHNVKPEKAEQIPAVRHIDGTARIQTVNRRQNPHYYDLIHAFGDKTGVPILVNTSFNTRGKPIVRTPADALACFMTSPIDVLVMGPFIIEK